MASTPAVGADKAQSNERRQSEQVRRRHEAAKRRALDARAHWAQRGEPPSPAPSARVEGSFAPAPSQAQVAAGERTVGRGEQGSVVNAVQQRLNALSSHGGEPLATDGKFGAQTEAAVRRYQQSEGLPTSGEVDRVTLERLGLSGDAFARAPEPPRPSVGAPPGASRPPAPAMTPRPSVGAPRPPEPSMTPRPSVGAPPASRPPEAAASPRPSLPQPPPAAPAPRPTVNARPSPRSAPPPAAQRPAVPGWTPPQTPVSSLRPGQAVHVPHTDSRGRDGLFVDQLQPFRKGENGAVTFSTNSMQVDTDGASSAHGSSTHQFQTTLSVNGRYADAGSVPFVALPPAVTKALGAKMGDMVRVTAPNGRQAWAIIADHSNNAAGRKLGEGSVALHRALGYNSTGAASHVRGEVKFEVFPGSGRALGTTRSSIPTAQQINQFGQRLEGTPSVPAPSVPAPSVPAPSVPAPSVPAPSVPAPSVPAPIEPSPAPSRYEPGPSREDVLLGAAQSKLGDQSRLVGTVQERLNALGVKDHNGQPLRLDGKLGPKTESAVKAFQQQHGLPATGVVDQATLQRLEQASPSAPAPQPRPSTPSEPTAPVRPTEPTAPSDGTNATARFTGTERAGQRNQIKTGKITVNGNTYDFVSGGSGRGNLPPGEYKVEPWSPSFSSMYKDGVGYSYRLLQKQPDGRYIDTGIRDPRFPGESRGLFRIHPDGGGRGTEGCIGIDTSRYGSAESARMQRQFKRDLDAELARARAEGRPFVIRVG